MKISQNLVAFSEYMNFFIPSSFLEQEEVEISAYLVQLDYYVPMLFMHWNNLSQAGYCTVIYKSRIPFGNSTISG